MPRPKLPRRSSSMSPLTMGMKKRSKQHQPVVKTSFPDDHLLLEDETVATEMMDISSSHRGMKDYSIHGMNDYSMNDFSMPGLNDYSMHGSMIDHSNSSHCFRRAEPLDANNSMVFDFDFAEEDDDMPLSDLTIRSVRGSKRRSKEAKKESKCTKKVVDPLTDFMNARVKTFTNNLEYIARKMLED